MTFVKLKQVVAIVLCACLLFSAVPTVSAQTASTAGAGQSPGGDPWPRVVTVQGAAISIFQPQLESWTGTQLDVRSRHDQAPRLRSDQLRRDLVHGDNEVDGQPRGVACQSTLTRQNFPTLRTTGPHTRAPTAPYRGRRRASDALERLSGFDRSAATACRRQQRPAAHHRQRRPRCSCRSTASRAASSGSPGF
jgi:hypothetical protein